MKWWLFDILILDLVAQTLSNFSMSTNWELCLFCQEKKRNEKERRKILSYSKIEMQLKKFIQIDLTNIELGRLDDGTGTAKTLKTYIAVYHKTWCDKIRQKEYNRLLMRVGKKPCSEANSSSSRVVPHRRTKSELGSELCIFCGERRNRKFVCCRRVSLRK